MSLVLEALKKLDREKGRDERGFVVMAAAPWPARAARWPAWAALGVATAGAVVAVMAWRTPSTRPPAPPASVAVPAAAAEARPAAAPEVVGTPAPPTPVTRVATTPAPPPLRERVAAKPVADPVPATPPKPAFVLQAISERGGQPIAIINDHLVRVGDEVDGMRVLEIRGAEVDVEVGGRRTTLRF